MLAQVRLHCIALACAAFVTAACGDTLVVSARVVRPAVLPVRAFPQVYVVSADDADSGAVADRLATHLAERPGPAGARVSVRRMARDRLNMLREGQLIERVSVVIRVRVTMDEEQRADLSSRPTTVCGPGGCYMSTRPYPTDIPILRAQAYFTVEDGRTGRVLQQTALTTYDEGSDPLSMRGRAVLDLAGRAPTLVDAGVRAVDVAFVELDDDAAQRALAMLERGSFARGATLLAQLVAAPSFARRPRGERAALLFDLGQARRFSGPEDATALARLDSALESMRAALRLEPRALYAEGLRDVERQRRDLALSAEQREAAAHNFALSRAPPPPVVPAVPAAYRDASPDAGAPQ